MIRLMKIEDYQQIIQLWQSIEGVGLRTIDDSKQGIETFLQRNPNTCFVYVENNRVVGTILSGNDGRRGYIYHLAVHNDYRRQSIGTTLVESVLDALKEENINKVALVVFESNEKGNKFWERLGFTKRDDLVYRNRSLNDMNK